MNQGDVATCLDMGWRSVPLVGLPCAAIAAAGKQVLDQRGLMIGEYNMRMSILGSRKLGLHPMPTGVTKVESCIEWVPL